MSPNDGDARHARCVGLFFSITNLFMNLALKTHHC